MPITELITNYFPKSKVFLLPALGLRINQHTSDLATYISWQNRYSINDCRLTVVKDGGRDNAEFQKFEKIYLQPSAFFEEMMFVNADLVAYIFNLEKMKKDWDYFLEARYSKLSPDLKAKIKHYYSAHENEWAYIQSFLFPEDHFDVYAELLFDNKERKKGLELIKSVGELCNPYDPEKEIFKVIPTMVEIPTDIT